MSKDRFDDNSDGREEKIRERVRNARDPSLPGAMASDVEAKRLLWLWPGYLPLGIFWGLEGDPAEGKSLVTLDFAARITTGADFPDGAKCKAGNVIIISGEDDPAITLRPRLEAAGADLSRARLWTSDLPQLPRDLSKLLRVIKADNARLVILDPVDSFYDDKIDPNSNPSIRRVLGPLYLAASELNCSICGVRHLNKDAKVGKAIYRGSGSIGFAGQARAVFLVNPTREDPELRVFARVKGNLSKPPPALGYRIVEATATAADGDEIKTQKIVWTGPVNTTADDLLREPEPARRGPKPEKLEAAKAFLREALKDGLEHQSDQIIAEGKEQGISKTTLNDAAAKLAVKRQKVAYVGDWLWSLPHGDSGNSDSSTNPHAEKGFSEDPESGQNSDSWRNSDSLGEPGEGPEFHENNSDSSANSFSQSDFMNSCDAPNPEDPGFPGVRARKDPAITDDDDEGEIA
jgi:AAA domain-containing protein